MIITTTSSPLGSLPKISMTPTIKLIYASNEVRKMQTKRGMLWGTVVKIIVIVVLFAFLLWAVYTAAKRIGFMG